MLIYGPLEDGLCTLSQMNNGSELSRYCKLEGMDYLSLVSESHSIKNLLGRRKYSRTEPAHASRTN